MSWILKDQTSGEYFCLPHGDDKREWSLNPKLAHQFLTEDRARGGATIWWHIHHRALEVIKCPESQDDELRLVQ